MAVADAAVVGFGGRGVADVGPPTGTRSLALRDRLVAKPHAEFDSLACRPLVWVIDYFEMGTAVYPPKKMGSKWAMLAGSSFEWEVEPGGRGGSALLRNRLGRSASECAGRFAEHRHCRSVERAFCRLILSLGTPDAASSGWDAESTLTNDSVAGYLKNEA